jgi:hypothetical protein
MKKKHALAEIESDLSRVARNDPLASPPSSPSQDKGKKLTMKLDHIREKDNIDALVTSRRAPGLRLNLPQRDDSPSSSLLSPQVNKTRSHTTNDADGDSSPRHQKFNIAAVVTPRGLSGKKILRFDRTRSRSNSLAEQIPKLDKLRQVAREATPDLETKEDNLGVDLGNDYNFNLMEN